MEAKQAHLIGGPIEGKVGLIVDDMISTAGSIVGAADVVRKAGAREIYIAATHGVFCGPAKQRLSESGVKEIIVTNSLPVTEDQRPDNLRQVSLAPLLGEAIRRIHRNESVSDLFD